MHSYKYVKWTTANAGTPGAGTVCPGRNEWLIMKLKKRKLKFAAIFFVCWFAFLVLLVDGILKFQTLLDYFGSYMLVETSLILLVILPTLAVYFFTKEK